MTNVSYLLFFYLFLVASNSKANDGISFQNPYVPNIKVKEVLRKYHFKSTRIYFSDLNKPKKLNSNIEIGEKNYKSLIVNSTDSYIVHLTI
jgi:hypothetical protein